jgi:type I restriction enzyme, R subunit
MDDALAKFILRPHQMRCVEKIVQRVVDGLADPDSAHTGLEWHTQGSGKTLTMIVTAHKLRRHPDLHNPTILIVVDRIELETQMCQNLEAFGLDAVRAESRDHLRRLLEGDSRGVLVTTIHKFDGMAKDRLTRRNVVILVDEAHRSQEGDLGIYLRAALPNAFHFGFTGTPIDRGKVGRGTFELFGHKDDPEGVHDPYTINESIEDGTTLPLYYTLAPTSIWVDKLALESGFADLLEEFWQVVDEEGAGTQEALSRLLQRADKLMAVLKSPQRIGAITAHIAQHFQENVMPLGFKGLIVTPDREACALYKQALDQYLPTEWSTVVYSDNPKRDSALMQSHYLDDDAEKAVRKAFRDPSKQPLLLIVTQKLLTGFDAPVAYVMYLDKPLKDHTLLQAIARVNRPYPDKKNGLIVDYIGVFKDLQRALAFDPAGIDRGLIDLETLKGRFVTLLAETQVILAPTDPHNPSGRTGRLIEHFWEEQAREAFFLQFKELQMAYEVLSPDPFLRDFIDAYADIADIYTTVRSYFANQDDSRRLQAELLNKTEELIQEHVQVYSVAEPLPLYPIDRNIADVIAQDKIGERVKVINLQRSLNAYIERNIERAPYLASISDEVERVIEQLHQRQISVQSALEQLQARAAEAAAFSEERAASSLDDLAFALRISLGAAKSLAPSDAQQADELVGDIAAYLQEHTGWTHNENLERQVRLELYRRLLPRMQKPVNPQQANAIVNDLLRMHRITL